MTSYCFDTGIFFTPLLKNQSDEIIARCLAWQERAMRGEIQAVTSFLAWDEVTWVAGKPAKGVPFNRVRAAEAGQLFLSFPNLRFIPVDDGVIATAQRLLRDSGHRSRDCIHASTALRHASGNLITIDADFSNLPIAGMNVVDLSKPGGPPL